MIFIIQFIFSHDLQTCDWPRNVGCVSSVSATASLNNANNVNTAPGNEELSLRQTTPSWKQALQPQQDEIPDVSALLNYSNSSCDVYELLSYAIAYFETILLLIRFIRVFYAIGL